MCSILLHRNVVRSRMSTNEKKKKKKKKIIEFQC